MTGSGIVSAMRSWRGNVVATRRTLNRLQCGRMGRRLYVLDRSIVSGCLQFVRYVALRSRRKTQ